MHRQTPLNHKLSVWYHEREFCKCEEPRTLYSREAFCFHCEKTIPFDFEGSMDLALLLVEKLRGFGLDYFDLCCQDSGEGPDFYCEISPSFNPLGEKLDKPLEFVGEAKAPAPAVCFAIEKAIDNAKA